MKLSFEQIKSITKGVARIEEIGEYTHFFRFTKEQEEAYKTWNTDFYNKTFATSGVRLDFETDSEHLRLRVKVKSASSRRFCAHDILINGKLIGQLTLAFDNAQPIPQTNLAGRYYLGEGKKRVTIYLPWSFSSALRELSLDDGASVEPISPKRKMIIFGDSITQGYDAVSPSMSYASKMADFLNADAVNKAIGGDIFRPELALLKDEAQPDLITVAYGTNDWGGSKNEEFEYNCKNFYKNLRATYPNTKIIGITPIWRADEENTRPVGDFKKLHDHIAELVGEIDNITLIKGYDFVPHSKDLFSDRFLHPNDTGFDHYARNLCAQLGKLLEI